MLLGKKGDLRGALLLLANKGTTPGDIGDLILSLKNI
jgi:hypothetical protein